MVFRIVVTEVTLYGKLRCVAGFDLDSRRMIRPEPGPAEFWPALVCGPNTTFAPGHVVRFNGNQPQTALPHRTEDVVVRGTPWREAKLNREGFRKILGSARDLSPDAVFQGHLRFDGMKAYVSAGAPCGSLAGLELAAADIRLAERKYHDETKLEAVLDLEGHELHLSVAAKDLKQAYQKEGLKASRSLLGNPDRLHVRLGLARPWKDHPNQCYLQVNGIYPL